MIADYAFVSVTEADLPMLKRWLQTPEVIQWWGEPEEQYQLLAEDLSNPLMVMKIVTYKDKPFAYIQDYNVHSWPQEWFAHLPPGTRGIDAFIGEPDMYNGGHGGLFLKARAEQLCREGAEMIVIDPDPENMRAIKAYQKAGFSGSKVFQGLDGPAVLMAFKMGNGG